MRSLPPASRVFPANTPRAIRLFWIRYWAWFFVLLPWMLLRQVGISLEHAAAALWTWNREVTLLDGALRLKFMNSVPSLLAHIRLR